MHHILVAYWLVYESANRVMIHKMQCTCCVDNFMELIQWQLWYNDFSVKWRFISWHTFSTVYKWLLPYYAPVVCTSQKAAEWSKKVSTPHSNHSIQSVYHTTFLPVILCECISVLKYVCPSISYKAPCDIALHTTEYIDSSSSLVHRCQWLIHRFQICPKLIAALNNVLRTIITG